MVNTSIPANKSEEMPLKFT